MAKTLSQIVADTRQIIGQPDSSNSQFTDAQLTVWINDAYRRVVAELRCLPVTTRDYSVSGQSVTLNSNVVVVDIAKLKDPDNANKYKNLRVIQLDELAQMDPDWESATEDVPSVLVRTGVFTAILYPPPKASVEALTTPLRLYGLELPTELSADSDTPNLPGNMHDILSHWAAFRCFKSLKDEASATTEITLFRGSLKEQKGVTTQFSRQLNAWRFEAVEDC